VGTPVTGEEDAVRSRDREQSGTADAHATAPVDTPQPSPSAAEDHGRDSRQTKLFRSRIVGLCGATICVLTFGGFDVAHTHYGSLWLLVPFVAFQAVSWGASIRWQPSDSKLVLQFDEAVFVAGALLLPPSGVVLVLGVGTGLGWVLGGTRPRTVFFNAGVFTAGVS